MKAIEEITSGKYGGGVFAIFPSTFKQTLPTEVTDIDFHYDPFDAYFIVKGAGEAQSQRIVNAKTGVALEAEVSNRDSFVFKKATVTSVNWSWQAGEISLRHEKKNGHISLATYSNEGCLA